MFFQKTFHFIVVFLGNLGRDMITALRPYSAFMGKWQKCEKLDDTHTQDTFFFHQKKVEMLVVFPGKAYKLFLSNFQSILETISRPILKPTWVKICWKVGNNFVVNFVDNFKINLSGNL